VALPQQLCTRAAPGAHPSRDSGRDGGGTPLGFLAGMANVISALTSPFFDLIDLTLESPLAALGVVGALGLVVLALVVAAG
jgi:hypothetical protein